MAGTLWTMVAAAAVAAGSPPTVQQLFDAAADATGRDDTATALADYDTIERRLGPSARPATLAIVRARRGLVLADLGRDDDAVAPLRYARANLPTGDASLRDDRSDVAQALGRIEERALDYAAATRLYRDAERDAVDPARTRAILGNLARVTMFDDPAAALKLADRALAVPSPDPVQAKAIDAQFRTLKARVLLNAKDYAAARKELDLAVKGLGGLTLKLDLSDVSARSDLAIAALLAGDREAARKYLAYTGAGTTKDIIPPPTAGLDVPPCGGEEGLTPDDVAVVEFNIRDDGTVIGVAPIYVSRPGPAALAFARSVATWAWAPEQIAKVKPFFRTLVRVELRCSTAQQRPDVLDLLQPAVEAWGARHATLTLPAADKTTSTEEQADAARRALAVAEAEKAPPAVIAYFAAREALGAGGRGYSRGRTRRIATALGEASHRPSIAADPQARATVTLLQADALLSIRDYAAAAPLLNAIAGDVALDARDPLKVGALLRLATVKAAAGDLDGARAAYARTGLTAQECALVDARPALVAGNTSSSDFPREAMQWGFEGWVQTEFDVSPSGRTEHVRATAAYPPFVFSPASVKVASNARFTQSFRPEGGLGCGGQQQRIRFGLPGFK